VRIVSLVPSQTELLADLGLDEEVVGLTRFCVRPEGWKERKTIVGGTKNLLPERIAAIRPTLTLANREENVREEVEPLAALAPVHVTDVATVAEAVAMVRKVGGLVGRGREAEALAEEIEAGFASLRPGRTRRAVYLIWREPYMTVGGDTFISDVMARAGLENVFADLARYPEVTPQEIAAARPEVLLLSSEPYPFGEEHADELGRALPDVDIRLVDGEVFSWYGSRMRYAPAALAALE
jgi:ABC-type Fe3+-hydroxamate transport system substrate-binding protein